jgi:hypothetical protein
VRSLANHSTQQTIRVSIKPVKEAISTKNSSQTPAKNNVLPLVGLAVINDTSSRTARLDGLMDMAFRVCRDTGAAVFAVTQRGATGLGCWAGETGVEEAAWEGEGQTKQ